MARCPHGNTIPNGADDVGKTEAVVLYPFLQTGGLLLEVCLFCYSKCTVTYLYVSKPYFPSCKNKTKQMQQKRREGHKAMKPSVRPTPLLPHPLDQAPPDPHGSSGPHPQRSGSCRTSACVSQISKCGQHIFKCTEQHDNNILTTITNCLFKENIQETIHK